MKVIDHKQKGFTGQIQILQCTANILFVSYQSYLSISLLDSHKPTMPRRYPIVLADRFTISVLSISVHILLVLFVSTSVWPVVSMALNLHLKENVVLLAS